MKKTANDKASRYDDLIVRRREYQRRYMDSLRVAGMRQINMWVSESQVPLLRAARALPPELLRRALIAATREQQQQQQ